MVQVKIIKFSELLDGHRLFINQKLHDVRGVEIVGGPAPAMSSVNFEARADGSAEWKVFAMPPKFEATVLDQPKMVPMLATQVAEGVRNALAGNRILTNGLWTSEIVTLPARHATQNDLAAAMAEVNEESPTGQCAVVEIFFGTKSYRVIVAALTLLLACFSGANAQQSITGAYNPGNARTLWSINPYISNPADRARQAYMDPDAVRIMESATSSAVIVQATANMPDAPFTFVNLTNASAASIEVLIVYSISGRGEFMHTRQLAPFQRVSIGLHDDIYTFYGRLNMSMTAYFVGRGAMEWSSYRPSPIDGDPPIEVDSKFAEFLPEVR